MDIIFKMKIHDCLNCKKMKLSLTGNSTYRTIISQNRIIYSKIIHLK